jgi:hypothetical protein
MSRLSFEFEDDLLERIKRYARAANSSVEELVKDHLTMIANQNDIERQRRARSELVRLFAQSPLEFGDWKWHREELYDRPGLSRYQRVSVRGDASDGR